MMKKIFLLMMMAVCAMGMQAKVDKEYASYKSVGNGNIELNADGKTFNVKGQSNNTYQMFEFEAGALKDYQTLNLNLEEKGVSFVRLLFMSGSSTEKTQTYYSTGKKTFNLTTDLTADQLVKITSIRIGGPNNGSDTYPATFVLDPASVYLETKDYDNLTIKTTVNGTSTISDPFVWVNKTGSITNSLGKDNNGTIFGYSTSNSLDNGYFDLTGYEKVAITLSAYNSSNSTVIRLLNGESSNHQTFNSFSSENLTIESLLTVAKCTSVKAGAGASSCQKVSSIVFSKDFKSSSTSAFSIAASTSSTIEYDREFVAGQKSTICLPFGLTKDEMDELGDFYYISGVSGDEIKFTKATNSVTPYNPYIFIAKETGKPFAKIENKAVPAYTDENIAKTKGAYTFIGVIKASTDVAADNEDKDVYGWSSASGKFVKVGTGVSINAFRAYITTPKSAGAKSIMASFDDGSVTEVEATEAEVAPRQLEVYNIAGQRVSANAKGMLIVNGKKMFRF